MGVLRLYLALCVVAKHCGLLFPWTAHNGLQAVEIFFLISGFYMALIASRYEAASEFYASRFLRIFMPYWCILAGVVVFCAVLGITTGKWLDLAPFANYSTDVNGLAGVLAAGFSNITAFGIDWFCFLTHDAGQSLSFSANALDSQSPLSQYIVINPAWSIGVELTFYLSVPWLNRCSTKTLVGLASLSLLSRIVAFEWFGLIHDPWTYRFTPFAMAMFILGMICCRVSRDAEPRVLKVVAERLPAFMKNYVFQVVCLLGGFWFSTQITFALSSFAATRYANLVSYLVWAALIPSIFALTKSNKLDRWIGELSYPVYLVHYSVLSLIAAVYTRVAWLPVEAKALVVSLISIAISVVLLQKIIGPLERRRSAWAKALVRIGGRQSTTGTPVVGRVDA